MRTAPGGGAHPVHAPSAQVREAVHQALAGGDAGGRPFAVVDKRQARMHVFRGDGHLLGVAPVLLGSARGDRAAAGAGLQAGKIAAHERITPAGRFESEPGRNHLGEAIVWIDYDAALAIHRLRPAAAHERRPQRLASDSPHDNRISLGCVVVDPGFYDAVVAPTLGRQRGIVYVLPEFAPGLPWLDVDTTVAPGAGMAAAARATAAPATGQP